MSRVLATERVRVDAARPGETLRKKLERDGGAERRAHDARQVAHNRYRPAAVYMVAPDTRADPGTVRFASFKTDVSDAALERGKASVQQSLARLVKKE